MAKIQPANPILASAAVVGPARTGRPDAAGEPQPSFRETLSRLKPERRPAAPEPPANKPEAPSAPPADAQTPATDEQEPRAVEPASADAGLPDPAAVLLAEEAEAPLPPADDTDRDDPAKQPVEPSVPVQMTPVLVSEAELPAADDLPAAGQADERPGDEMRRVEAAVTIDGPEDVQLPEQAPERWEATEWQGAPFGVEPAEPSQTVTPTTHVHAPTAGQPARSAVIGDVPGVSPEGQQAATEGPAPTEPGVPVLQSAETEPSAHAPPRDGAEKLTAGWRQLDVEPQAPAPSVAAIAAPAHAEPAGKPAVSPSQPPPSPDASFSEANHPDIVTAIRTQLLPRGGSMRIRLDPPELGAIQIHVRIQEGIITASFQTSTDDATRLLSHSLHQLRQSLETQGISVERLQVEQAPRERSAGGSGQDEPHQQHQDQPAQQEQHRRELLQRMWRRLRGGRDPLDLVG